MGTKVKKTKTAVLSEKLAADSLLINKALDLGQTSKSMIMKGTGLKLYEINNVFQKDRDTYAKFKIMRGTLVDIAADNMQNILQSPGHPSHFAATKYILQTYKSDLDDSMVEKKGDSLEIETGKGKKSPIKIRFGK